MPRPKSACAPTPGRRRRRKSGRVYAMRQALGRRLPVPLRSPLRRRQRFAGLADGRRAGAVHRAARRNHGDRADLPAEIADRRIQGAGHAGRSRPAAVAEGELDHRPAAACTGCRTFRSAPPSCSTIPRSTASTDRSQTPLASASHVELHGRIAEGSAQDNPVIETVLQICGRQRAGGAPAAGGAVRCRRRRPG